MAHEIEFDANGKAYAFTTAKPAWWDTERSSVLSEAPTVEAAVERICPFQLMLLDLSASIQTGEGLAYMPIETHKAVMRSDGTHIGTVGADYELEQYRDGVDFMEPLVSAGHIELEAGGLLRGGSRMWVLGKLKGGEADVVKGDAVKSYLLAATSFDGTMSKVIKFCATRVVCANTLAVALGEKGEGEWRIRHTRGLKDAVANVGALVKVAMHDHMVAVTQYKTLAARQWNEPKMKAYVRRVILGAVEPEEVSTAMENKIQTVTELLETQRGIDLIPAIRGTAWQAYNAVTEYVTHHAGRNEDNRLNNQWFGETAKVNAKALELALSY